MDIAILVGTFLVFVLFIGLAHLTVYLDNQIKKDNEKTI